MAHTLASAATCHGSPSIRMVWSLRLLAAGLRRIHDGLWEGFAAYREYDHLTAKGIPHDTALRRAFRVSSD
jgi:hypothetical protein